MVAEPDAASLVVGVRLPLWTEVVAEPDAASLVVGVKVPLWIVVVAT
jgi:hypothetical protein